MIASQLLDLGRLSPTRRSMRCPKPQQRGPVACHRVTQGHLGAVDDLGEQQRTRRLIRQWRTTWIGGGGRSGSGGITTPASGNEEGTHGQQSENGSMPQRSERPGFLNGHVRHRVRVTTQGVTGVSADRTDTRTSPDHRGRCDPSGRDSGIVDTVPRPGRRPPDLHARSASARRPGLSEVAGPMLPPSVFAWGRRAASSAWWGAASKPNTPRFGRRCRPRRTCAGPTRRRPRHRSVPPIGTSTPRLRPGRRRPDTGPAPGEPTANGECPRRLPARYGPEGPRSTTPATRRHRDGTAAGGRDVATGPRCAPAATSLPSAGGFPPPAPRRMR